MSQPRNRSIFPALDIIVPAPEITVGDPVLYSHVAAAANRHLTMQVISILFPDWITMDEIQEADRQQEELKREVEGRDNPGSIQNIQDLLRQMKGELQQLNLKFDGHTEQFKVLDRKVDGHSTQLLRLTNEITKGSGELNGLKNEVKELRSEVKELRSEVKELRSEVQELRSDQSIFLSTLGTNVAETIADHIRVLNTQTRNV